MYKLIKIKLLFKVLLMLIYYRKVNGIYHNLGYLQVNVATIRLRKLGKINFE